MNEIMDLTALITVNSTELIEQIIKVFIGLATVGVLAMAIVEVIKLFPLRYCLNKYILSVYFDFQKYTMEKDHNEKSNCSNEAEHTNIEAFDRLSAGSGWLFYGFKPEDISQLIYDEAIHLINYPTLENQKRLLLLCGGNRIDGSVAKAIEEQLQELETLVTTENGDQFNRLKKIDEIRERTLNHIQNRLTGMRFRMNYWWALSLKCISVVISIATIYLILGGGKGVGVLLFAVFGGMIAPSAHDILAAITARRVSYSN